MNNSLSFFQLVMKALLSPISKKSNMFLSLSLSFLRTQGRKPGQRKGVVVLVLCLPHSLQISSSPGSLPPNPSRSCHLSSPTLTSGWVQPVGSNGRSLGDRRRNWGYFFPDSPSPLAKLHPFSITASTGCGLPHGPSWAPVTPFLLLVPSLL